MFLLGGAKCSNRNVMQSMIPCQSQHTPDAQTSRKASFHSIPILPCMQKEIQTKLPKMRFVWVSPKGPRGSPCTSTSCKMTAAQSPARSFDPCIIHITSTLGHDLVLGHSPRLAGTPLESLGGYAQESTQFNSLTYHGGKGGGGLHFKFWSFVPPFYLSPQGL